jgi:hypothetical protein
LSLRGPWGERGAVPNDGGLIVQVFVASQGRVGPVALAEVATCNPTEQVFRYRDADRGRAAALEKPLFFRRLAKIAQNVEPLWRLDI